MLELKEGDNFSLSFSFNCGPYLTNIVHTLSCRDHAVHATRVFICASSVCFQNLKREDDGVYIISSRNVKSESITFQLRIKCKEVFLDINHHIFARATLFTKSSDMDTYSYSCNLMRMLVPLSVALLLRV